MHDPVSVVFFQDELYGWLCSATATATEEERGGNSKLKYTLKEYRTLFERVEQLRARLGLGLGLVPAGENDPAEAVITAVEVEKVGFVVGHWEEEVEEEGVVGGLGGIQEGEGEGDEGAGEDVEEEDKKRKKEGGKEKRLGRKAPMAVAVDGREKGTKRTHTEGTEASASASAPARAGAAKRKRGPAAVAAAAAAAAEAAETREPSTRKSQRSR